MAVKDDKIAHILGVVDNFLNEPDSKYEPYVIDPDNWVFRLAHRPRSVNVMIKFDPDEVLGI